MIAILHFFAAFITVLLDAVSLAMLVRMILSFFPSAEESRISLFLALVTEPFIVPIRYLMAKFNILQNSPIDWSFTFSCFVIALLQMVLPAI